MARLHDCIDHIFSGLFPPTLAHSVVVPLGIFSDVFPHGERIHWRSQQYWLEKYPRCSKCRKFFHSRFVAQFLPKRFCWVSMSLYGCFNSRCAAQIVMGGSMERGALGPSCMFIFIWTTIVYDAVACWTWNPAGWLFKLGTLDYAGGGMRPSGIMLRYRASAHRFRGRWLGVCSLPPPSS